MTAKSAEEPPQESIPLGPSNTSGGRKRSIDEMFDIIKQCLEREEMKKPPHERRSYNLQQKSASADHRQSSPAPAERMKAPRTHKVIEVLKSISRHNNPPQEPRMATQTPKKLFNFEPPRFVFQPISSCSSSRSDTPLGAEVISTKDHSTNDSNIPQLPSVDALRSPKNKLQGLVSTQLAEKDIGSTLSLREDGLQTFGTGSYLCGHADSLTKLPFGMDAADVVDTSLPRKSALARCNPKPVPVGSKTSSLISAMSLLKSSGSLSYSQLVNSGIKWSSATKTSAFSLADALPSVDTASCHAGNPSLLVQSIRKRETVDASPNVKKQRIGQYRDGDYDSDGSEAEET